jgi:hypothetical protein
MRKTGILALSLVALTALAATTAGATVQKPRCRVATGGHEIRHTSRVLVYANGDRVIGCLKPNGKRHYFAEDDGIYRTVTIDAIHGTYVTWTESYSPECKADCPPGVTGSTNTFVINLKTGKIAQ